MKHQHDLVQIQPNGHGQQLLTKHNAMTIDGADRKLTHTPRFIGEGLGELCALAQ